MNNYTCGAPLRQNIRPNPANRINSPFSIHKSDWKPAQLLRHTVKAGSVNRQQKFRDCHPLPWRTHRHHMGGFLSSVDCVNGGIVPGSRGLQHGANRNKRVAFQGSDDRPRPFLPTVKNNLGVTAMTALNTGVSRPLFPHGFPPRVPLHLQNPPKTKTPKPETAFRFNALTVHHDGQSHLFTEGGRPRAWILEGHHHGQLNKQRKTSRFTEVVWLRETCRGINLETRDFDRLPDALAFVYGLFEQGGAA